MKTNHIKNKKSAELRKKTEAKPEPVLMPIEKLSDEEVRKLANNLQMKWIELERQNDELRRDQKEREDFRLKYSAIYDRAPVGYFTIDEKGLILAVNQTGADMLGVQRNLLVKNSLSLYITREDQDKYNRYRMLIFEKKEYKACELRMVKEDGTTYYAQLECAAALYIEMGFSQCKLIITSITERKRAELAVMEARGYAENIIEMVHEPLVVLDSNLYVIFANKSFYKKFMVFPEDTEGKLIYELGNRQWDIPKLRHLLENILPDNEMIDDYMVEHLFESIGKKVMLLNARHMIKRGGEDKLILLSIEDITERINTENKIKIALIESWEYKRNLVAIFKDGIIMVDREQRILEFNDLAGRICGFPDINNARGKKFQSFIRGCNGSCLENLFETTKKNLLAERRRFECFSGDKSRSLVRVSAYPLFDNQEQFNGCVIVVRNETRAAVLEGDIHECKHFQGIIGKSGNMQKIFSMIETLSDSPTTVLITGESGTGKRLVAEALHYHGKGSENIPYVVISCSSLSDSILESELFGHVKGAFTGAVNDRIGRFEKAEGGTIFLDEIGDISDAMQLRLLRVLEEKVFERVGDSNTIKANVRVIAATNQNLRRKVNEGKFREDLYHRLKVVELTIPSLRDRREDIPLLVEHFVGQLNVKLNKQIKSICPNVLKIFMDYKWPGNIRELYHTMEYAFVTSNDNVITMRNLPYDFEITRVNNRRRGEARKINDRLQVLQALEKTDWNKAKAARLLDIHRATIYKMMKKHNITKEERSQ